MKYSVELDGIKLLLNSLEKEREIIQCCVYYITIFSSRILSNFFSVAYKFQLWRVLFPRDLSASVSCNLARDCFTSR